MGSISVLSADRKAVQDRDACIPYLRETEPLPAHTGEVTRMYGKAFGCQVAAVDRTGQTGRISESGRGHLMRFCSFCGKYRRNTSRIWDGNGNLCTDLHLGAVAKSRHTAKTYVYSCPAGFIYWTGPLYRNGRYCGALIAGQVLPPGRETAAGKFRALCRDKNAADTFAAMLEEVPVKSHGEIMAMARILGICGEGISGKGNGLTWAVHRAARQEYREKPAKEHGPDQWDIPGNQANLAAPAAGKNAGPDGALCASVHSGPEEIHEKERLLFAAFRRGDNKTGCMILKELMECTAKAIPEDPGLLRFRAMELVVLLSRAAAGRGTTPETTGSGSLLEASKCYLRRLGECQTPGELTAALTSIAGRMAAEIFSFQGVRHSSVLRRAERFIWENYTRKISLEEIAKASGLSAPYFSTVFKEEMNENLSVYINRVRIGRAAALLTGSSKTLGEIAGICGFEDQSWFSKIFKKFTGMSPGKYRENCGWLPGYKDDT